MPTDQPSPIARLRGAVDVLVREMLKFGVVGAVALVVDVGTFNALRFVGGHGPLYDKPLTAKVISVTLATLTAWAGNRYWTFRHRRRTAVHHELALFVVFNVVGMGIALGC
ncbi:MAG: GtrA family protein, partial [Oryzihumus sp.]